jgi:F-type H+-transporting ATPase subunit epsilon
MVDVAAQPGSLRCIVVTPEETVLDTSAEFVALPLFDGEVGILPMHSPMIGRLGYGELRIRTAGVVSRFYVDGGFVQVLDNVVSVLTNRALPADQVRADTASELLQSALARKAAGDDEMALRDRLMAQGRGQLRVAGGTTTVH